MAKWLQVNNEGNKAEILIQGQIGGSWFDESGMTEKEFTDALNEIPDGKPITIGINSEGGSVKDGLGIYNAIYRKKETNDITCRIDGYAVSIASVIPLAADKRISPKSSIWMIHEPWMMAMGNANDMLRAAEMLEAHAETITDIYADRTGLSKEDAREKMKAETWFRGSEAKQLGFSTEETEDAVALNAFNPESLKHFRNIPTNILQSAHNEDQTSHLKANTPAPVTPADSISSGDIAAANGKQTNNTKTKDSMEDNKNAAAPTPAVDLKPIMDKLAEMEAKLNTSAAPAPIAPGISVIGNASDKLVKMMHGPQHTEKEIVQIARNRRSFIINAWSDIIKSRITPEVKNSNTIAAGLTTELLSTTVITNLQSKIAGLQAMSILISPDPIKPKCVVELPNVTAGPTAQTNPTNWESGNSTVAAVSVTPAELSVSFHITNAELQGGTQIGWLTSIAAAKLANSIMDAAMVPVTVANFGAASYTGAAVGFVPSDLAAVRADIKDADIKNLLLDGAYYSRACIAYDNDMIPVSQGQGGFGFDSIYENNRWLNEIIGFACSPQAIAGVAGLPIDPPNGGAFTSIGSSVVPGVNLPIQTSSWTVPSTRLQWMCYDLIFGVALADSTAGTVMTSA